MNTPKIHNLPESHGKRSIIQMNRNQLEVFKAYSEKYNRKENRKAAKDLLPAHLMTYKAQSRNHQEVPKRQQLVNWQSISSDKSLLAVNKTFQSQKLQG